MARQYYAGSNAGPVSTSSNSVWSDVVSTAFTPDASSDYVVFWSFAFQNASNSTADAQARFRIGGTDQGEINVESRNTEEYPQFAGFYRYQSGGSPSSITADIQIKAETNGNTINAKNGQIVAVKLGAGDLYAESLTRATTTSTTLQEAVGIAGVHGGATKKYLVIAYAEIDTTATTAPVYLALTDGLAVSPEVSTAVADTTNVTPVMIVWETTLYPDQDYNFALRYRAHSGLTAGIQNARLIVLDVSGFDDEAYATLTSDASGTEFTYTTALTLTDTVTSNPLLVLGAWFTSSTTSATAVSTRLVQGGSQIGESVRRSYNAAAVRQSASGFVGISTGHSAGSLSWTLDRKASRTVNNAVSAGSALAYLDLGSEGGTPSVTPNNAAHTHTASSPSLSAKSSVTPNSAAHSQTATSPSLAAQATISPDGASHGQSATSPTLAAQSSVAPNDAAHATSSTSPTVGVPVAISPDSAVSAHTASSPTIAANSSIAPDDSAHAHTASSPTVTTANSVAPDNAAHAQTASEPTITAASSVSVDDAAHGHSASSPSLSAQSAVQPDDAAHGHTASEPSLSAASTVAPDDANHASSATSPTVSTGGSVAVDSTAHDQTATSPTIAAQSSVSVDSAAHALTSTSPTVSAASSVQPNDASHAQAATSPSIAAKASVSVDSAAHGHEASSPTLSGSLAITPASAVHAHIAGQPTIAWRGMIAANDAAHETTASSPSLAARSAISPDSATHEQVATSPLLASASSIAVASAFHDHLASSPTIRITLPSSDRRAAGSLRPRTTATTEPSRVASPSREARIAQPARPPRVVATATRKRIAS